MANQDVLPKADPDFDTLQQQLVAAVVLKAVTWGIPAGEVTNLTEAQAPWTAAWAVAKFKDTSTPAQKKAKTVARKNYSKPLRKFIQAFIYRNDLMDDDAIEECGLKPRDHTRTSATKPAKPEAKVERGESLELVPSCKAQKGTKLYGCIMFEGAQMPSTLTFTADGKLVFTGVKPPNPIPNPQIPDFQIDLNEQRIKHYTALKHNVEYFFYFFSVNSAGVSVLSDKVSMVCYK